VDLWSSSLLNRGVIFFGLTINFVKKDSDDNLSFSIDDEITGRDALVQLNRIFSEIDFIECSFGSIEIGERGIPHTHWVIGFRSHFNSVSFIREKIEFELTTTWNYDYKLSYLKYFKDVVQSIRYLSKEFDKKRNLNLAFFCTFSTIFENIHNKFGEIIENMMYIEEHTILFYFGHLFGANSAQYVPLGKHHNLIGIPLKIQDNEVQEISYYLQMYLYHKEMFFYKNSLYKKIENTRISYSFIGDEEILKDNFLNFMLELKNELFDFIDPISLAMKFSENHKKIIDEVKILCRYFKKNLSFDIMEFADGIYLARFNRFISDKTLLESFKRKFFTVRFYDVTYKNLLSKNNFPPVWKSKLLLNFDEETFKSFCLVFRNILFGSEEKTKRNILFLIGVSNSGKSRLVLDVAKNSIGIENVGSFSSDNNFLFENLVGKQIAILDEPDLPMKILNVLKKFGSGEALTINAKFQKATFGELTTQILASSNNTPQIKSVLNDEAIKSRIWKFVLENECPLTNEEHQKIIKEIPKILVYCNKLYFESLTEKKILTNKKLSKLFFEEKLKFLE
jgi:hypothetical protein